MKNKNGWGEREDSPPCNCAKEKPIMGVIGKIGDNC
jgi:hypothetical protein